MTQIIDPLLVNNDSIGGRGVFWEDELQIGIGIPKSFQNAAGIGTFQVVS